MRREHIGNPPHDIVTISAGFLLFQEGLDPVRVFRAVDDLLYEAKAAGRNRVVEARV